MDGLWGFGSVPTNDEQNQQVAVKHGNEVRNSSIIEQPAAKEISAASHRRPGPFGPAWALLPKDQQLLVIDDDTPAHDPSARG